MTPGQPQGTQHISSSDFERACPSETAKRLLFFQGLRIQTKDAPVTVASRRNKLGVRKNYAKGQRFRFLYATQLRPYGLRPNNGTTTAAYTLCRHYPPHRTIIES